MDQVEPGYFSRLYIGDAVKSSCRGGIDRAHGIELCRVEPDTVAQPPCSEKACHSHLSPRTSSHKVTVLKSFGVSQSTIEQADFEAYLHCIFFCLAPACRG